MSDRPPCVLFEDEHLLAVNKPAGLNTHAPSPYAGEGIYDWLRHREPHWARLAIIHRLDKETSGVLVFSKSAAANRSLTRQFTERSVRKRYILLTDRAAPSNEFTARSVLVRLGEKYVSRPGSSGSEAETTFHVLKVEQGRTWIIAEPRTGRTHQIRVQAAEYGFPVLGDALYGGTRWRRVCLHAAELKLAHPITGEPVTFEAPPNFEVHPGIALREALISTAQTDAYRLAHGAADGHPGWFIDRLGKFLLSASDELAAPRGDVQQSLEEWTRRYSLGGIYCKRLQHCPGNAVADASPQHVSGDEAPNSFEVVENGVRYSLSFNEGYSIGLFLDQRDNRRRILTGHIATDFPLYPGGPEGAEVLNTFAYTCAFSVCAALAGAQATSLDLSKRYLDWGKRNFELNHLDPDGHDFIYGDAFDWLRRLAKKSRTFDLVILDPPTFSRSKQQGTFQVEKDYPRLVQAALPLVKPGGVLLASTNAATLKAELFVEMLDGAVVESGRRIDQRQYIPQPPDFPITREEPAYLKTIWLRIGPVSRTRRK